MNARFACPICERPDILELPAAPWQCSGCDHRLEPRATDPALAHCPLCGNHELYRKKDFPHWLGLLILTVGCLAFALGNALYQQYWAWGILLGTAVLDAFLYHWVGDAVVCYRCNAHFRGVPAGAEHKPYELVIAERYRQEHLLSPTSKVQRPKSNA